MTTPTKEWREEYRKRFLEKRELSDGTSSEYIRLKGTALDTDFQDFVQNLLDQHSANLIERLEKYVNENYSRSAQPLYAHVDAKDLLNFIHSQSLDLAIDIVKDNK